MLLLRQQLFSGAAAQPAHFWCTRSMWLGHQQQAVGVSGQDLRNYCDPLEDYISGRLEKDPGLLPAYKDLRRSYVNVGMAAHEWNLPDLLTGGEWSVKLGVDHPDAWTFMDWLRSEISAGLNAFDSLFGESWRFR